MARAPSATAVFTMSSMTTNSIAVLRLETKDAETLIDLGKQYI
jgi:hypothetical protein